MNLTAHIKVTVATLALGAFALSPALANGSTLIGDTVKAVFLYPDTTSVYQDLGTKVVGASTPTYLQILGQPFNVNITATQIVTDWGTTGVGVVAAFNGIRFTNLTHPFTSATIDPANETPGLGVFMRGGDIFINYSDLRVINGSKSIVDVTTGTVPEPASWMMLIAGFGLAGAAMRRRRIAVVSA